MLRGIKENKIRLISLKQKKISGKFLKIKRRIGKSKINRKYN